MNKEKVVNRAQKTLVTNSRAIQAEIDEKQYKDSKKKAALQRVQDEINAQNQKQKIMKEHKERMRKKREEIQLQKEQEREAQLGRGVEAQPQFSFKVNMNA